MTSPKSLLAAASAAQTTAVRRDERAPATRARHDRMANAIRALAMDAVEQAKSGHPGLPMGAADVATVLFKRFLQLGSITPGHPESFLTPGVETTTGPLGQGLGNAVGMAIAEGHLAAQFGSEL